MESEQLPLSLRLLYLPNEESPNSLQYGPRAAFEDMLSDRTLSDYQVFSFLQEANSLGDVIKWENKLLSQAKEFQPTVIFWQHIGNVLIKANLLIQLKNLPSKPLLVYHEADPFARIRKKISLSMKLLSKFADLVFLVGLGDYAELFREAGARNIIYTPNCADTTLFGKDWNPYNQNRSGLVMIGNHITSNPIIESIPPLRFPGSLQRKQLAVKLYKKFGDRFKVYGRGWEKYPFSAGEVQYANQEIVLRHHLLSVIWDHYPDIPFNFSDRLPNTLLSGVAFATNYHPGFELLFKNGEQLVYYQSIQEAVDIVDWMLCQPREYLIEMGLAGEQFIRSKMTVHIVYRRMMEIIKEKILK